MEEVKITERGWAGHFICADSCRFRRNTLIEYDDKKWIVSTVGLMKINGKIKTIGANDRYYETKAFEAEFKAPYWEADIGKQIDFNSNWSINKIDNTTDLLANEMHENVVNELMLKIKE